MNCFKEYLCCLPKFVYVVHSKGGLLINALLNFVFTEPEPHPHSSILSINIVCNEHIRNFIVNLFLFFLKYVNKEFLIV